MPRDWGEEVNQIESSVFKGVVNYKGWLTSLCVQRQSSNSFTNTAANLKAATSDKRTGLNPNLRSPAASKLRVTG